MVACDIGHRVCKGLRLGIHTISMHLVHINLIKLHLSHKLCDLTNTYFHDKRITARAVFTRVLKAFHRTHKSLDFLTALIGSKSQYSSFFIIWELTGAMAKSEERRGRRRGLLKIYPSQSKDRITCQFS